MLILLSPAKKLDYDSLPITPQCSQPDMLNEAEYLIRKLKKMSSRQIARMMKISPVLSQLNYERYQHFHTPFTPQNAKQAILTFKGDVYTGLNAEQLSKDDLQFAQEHLRILSGLYGLLKPLDLIQPYRLEMGSRFAVSVKKTNLYQYWGDKINQAVNQALQDQGDDILINLASNEYFKAVQAKNIQGRIITPGFKDLKNGQYKSIFLWVKQARGMMARYIIKNRILRLEEIKDFSSAGYRYNAGMSTSYQWVFTRDQPQ